MSRELYEFYIIIDALRLDELGDEILYTCVNNQNYTRVFSAKVWQDRAGKETD